MSTGDSEVLPAFIIRVMIKSYTAAGWRQKTLIKYHYIPSKLHGTTTQKTSIFLLLISTSISGNSGCAGKRTLPEHKLDKSGISVREIN